ncbi:MAG: radical SAM protein [Proteobacteria bacterium]|nr:radical SAM protein [Pseudomonadota bacterium]MBU4469211.1 radical SAM protein [Pseudomonadota bacterium]MCG2752242.1 radical SAM protein [Desulfobacteraceae bacterium]
MQTIQKKTVSFSKNAANIFFHILTKCNLKCRHCYINPKQHGKNTLALEVIEKWLYFFSKKHKDANLILLGGEPTLHPDLHRVIKTSRDLGYQSVTVDTNGYLFHDILDRVSPEEVDYFSFSLDGATEGLNDGIRGKGSFARCLSGLEKASRAGFQTSLIYTVSRMNIHELDAFSERVRHLPVNRVFIQVIGLRGKSGSDQQDGLQVSLNQWLDLVPKAAESMAKQGKKVVYPKVFLHPGEPFECAGKVASNYFIFPNGRVYQCPLCEDFPLNRYAFKNDRLEKTPKINEGDLFELDISEGCVMNRLIQPDNIPYDDQGAPRNKIACCLLKEEVSFL